MMRQWMISTWDGQQLKLKVVSAQSLCAALHLHPDGRYDKDIVKVEEVPQPEDRETG